MPNATGGVSATFSFVIFGMLVCLFVFLMALSGTGLWEEVHTGIVMSFVTGIVTGLSAVLVLRVCQRRWPEVTEAVFGAWALFLLGFLCAVLWWDDLPWLVGLVVVFQLVWTGVVAHKKIEKSKSSTSVDPPKLPAEQ